MSINLIINGTPYPYPEEGDEQWGSDATAWAVAVTSGMLQKTGGLFQLLGEIDFGPNFGLKSIYYKSRNANPSASGVVRLGNQELISWRDFTNSGDLGLTVNASDQLEFNGDPLSTIFSVTDTATIVLSVTAGVLSADLELLSVTNAYLAAGIDATKIADGSVSDTEFQYLGGVTSDIQTQLNAKQGTTLPNANIWIGNVSNVAQAQAVTGDISLSPSGVTAYVGTMPITKGGTGATSKTAGFDGLSPMAVLGDLIYGGTSGTGTRLGVGSNGQVLTVSAGLPSWASPSASPTASYELLNLGLATSVSSNALTIALKQSDGTTDPASGGGAVKVGFRSATSTSGAYSEVSVTAALSLVVSSGSTLGQTSAVAGYLYVYLLNNSGAAELAVSGTRFPDHSIVSTTAEGGAGAADSLGVIYSASARSNVPMRLIGRILITETTAGTWASNATEIALPTLTQMRVSPTIQRFTSGSGTYTTPAGILYIDVEIVGGGGGGGGGGAGSTGGGTGGSTSFGTALMNANGGVGGEAAGGGNPGAGGSATSGTGPLGFALSGSSGQGVGAFSGSFQSGGSGGCSPYGGAGGGRVNSAGSAAVANSGSGGGGGGTNASGSQAGAGGGAGGYAKAIITNPLSTYAYAVGAAGTAGAAGTNGFAGGAGGSGGIIVREYYQ